MRSLLAGAVLAMLPIAAFAQSVSEDIHDDASGPVELCGLTAETVPEFEALVRAQPDMGALQGTAEYTAYRLGNDRFLTFTTSANRAHPAVACRSLDEEGGDVFVTTRIRCANSRENCDWLYLEFEALDARMQAALREQVQSQ